MEHHKAAIRYAKTLFASASQKEALEQVVQDMKTLSAVFTQTPEFSEFLKNPLITRAQVERVVSTCFVNKLNTLTVSFVRFLQKKCRLNLMGLIPELFIELYEKERDIMRVTILSAKKLSTSQLERLEGKLKKVYMSSSFFIDNVIDPSVIAGFQIRIGDTIFDANLKNNLHRLKRHLAA